MNSPYSNSKQYLAQLEGVEQQIKQNRLQDAAQKLNLLAKANARDPRLFLLGSHLAEASNNPDGMLVAARKAHQLAPEWPVATLHLAGVLAHRGEVETAMALAETAVGQATANASIDPELLTKAAAIANRFGLHSQALQWLRQAQLISPDEASIRYKTGLSLSYSGEPDQAIAIFDDLLLQKPNNPALLVERLRACLSAGQSAQAVRDGQALLALEPESEVYRFYLDVAHGLTPETQPASLISIMFDDIAAGFDRFWVVTLQYKLPRDVAQMINQWHPDHKGDVLDLGCGTGLLGVCLGRIEGVLVGVDLSVVMISQAARHKVYDRFHHVNLLDALQATPGDLYHVITALDVLSYVGDLTTVIVNAWRILLPGGRFVFSCETSVEGSADYIWRRTLRYRHQRSYVQRLLLDAGFEDIDVQDLVLRIEADQPVHGFLVVARRPLNATKKIAPRSARNSKRVSTRQS